MIRKEAQFIIETRAHGYYNWVRESPPILRSLEEAIRVAEKAESMGDTVGLQAQIILWRPYD